MSAKAEPRIIAHDFTCTFCGATAELGRGRWPRPRDEWDWFRGFLPARVVACPGCRETRKAEIAGLRKQSRVRPPPPESEPASPRCIRGRIRRAAARGKGLYLTPSEVAEIAAILPAG